MDKWKDTELAKMKVNVVTGASINYDELIKVLQDISVITNSEMLLYHCFSIVSL